MELAVNMPAHEPQVGQAHCSASASWASLMPSLAAMTIASIRSILRIATSCVATLGSMPRPASIGPPDTKMAGMFSRMAAMSMPGVTLSQLLMHTSASAQCAFAMYSTLSAIRSRLGRE